MQGKETYQHSFKDNAPVSVQTYTVIPRYNRAGHIETIFKPIAIVEGPAMISYGTDARLRIERHQVAVIQSIPLLDFRTVITHLQDGTCNEKSVMCTTDVLKDMALMAHVKNRG